MLNGDYVLLSLNYFFYFIGAILGRLRIHSNMISGLAFGHHGIMLQNPQMRGNEAIIYIEFA